MWFKNIQLLPLSDSSPITADELETQLTELTFRPCAPTLPHSAGWVSPIELDGAPLVHRANDYLLMCLQVEEKLLPSTVVRQELNEKIKSLETKYDRKIRAREKNAIKDEITHTLMPRAFTKITRLYAYIDTKHNWLVLDTTNMAKTEMFLSLLQKTAPNLQLAGLELKTLPKLMAHWLKNESYPKSLAIEKSAVLQDANQKGRIIRVAQQDLFSDSIQTLLKEGCHVTQIALNWNDQVHFTLHEDFSVRSIKFQDAVIELANESYSETAEQKFDADFVIMTETLSHLLQDLLSACEKQQAAASADADAELVAA